MFLHCYYIVSLQLPVQLMWLVVDKYDSVGHWGIPIRMVYHYLRSMQCWIATVFDIYFLYRTVPINVLYVPNQILVPVPWLDLAARMMIMILLVIVVAPQGQPIAATAPFAHLHRPRHRKAPLQASNRNAHCPRDCGQSRHMRSSVNVSLRFDVVRAKRPFWDVAIWHNCIRPQFYYGYAQC